MNRILIIGSILPNVLGIIVNDPPGEDITYKYSYNVQDPANGDRKSQQESRYGDKVSGSYSVIDPDGIKRTVSYTADARDGFKAIILKEPANPALHNYAPEPTAVIFAPTADYPQYYIHVPQRLYTSAISAPTSFATYLAKVPGDSIPYYPTENRVVQVGQRLTTYFRPTQDKKAILRDSLGPGKYFEPSSTYHK